MIYNRFKEICLLVAGGFIGLLATLFAQEIEPIWYLVLISTVVLIFIGSGGWGLLRITYFNVARWRNDRKKRMGIFSPYEIDANTSSWVNVSRRQIQSCLDKNRTPYKLLSDDNTFRKFGVIMNPFGGGYPENDVSELETVNKIFEYVKTGGTFINIADVPFYYAYDRNLNRKVDTTPLAGNFSVNRPFLYSLLTKKLRVFVLNSEKMNNGTKRIISLTEGANNFYSSIIPVEDSNFSPYIAMPYGRGHFVFSTFEINIDNINSLKGIISNAFSLI
ncbi:MAG: hypothetical protein AAB792_01300 [Patescibacteria group bacterium]